LGERSCAVGERIDGMASALQPADQKVPQLIVVFGQQNVRHMPKVL
jgi:hypothetical protein